MFDKMENNFDHTARRAKAGMLGIGLAIALVALALTVVGIVLAVTVSPWFWIAVVITGGYTLISVIWTFAVGSIFKRVS